MKALRRGALALAGRRVRYTIDLGPLRTLDPGHATAEVLFTLNRRDVAVFTDRWQRPVPLKANRRRKGWR